MSITPNNLNLMLGAGELWFWRDDIDIGYVHLGNCTSLETSFEDEIKKVVNRMNNTLGTYRRITSERVANLTIVGQEFNPDNIALVSMGTTGVLSQGASSVTAEVLATALQAAGERAYSTEFRQISAVVIKQGATTLILDDDYTIEDVETGLITFHTAGGAFTPGVRIDIDYTHAADTDPTVAGGDVNTIEGKLLFIGDPATGPTSELLVHKMSIEPEGALELIGDDVLDWTLTGEALDDTVNNPNFPFWRWIDRQDYR